MSFLVIYNTSFLSVVTLGGTVLGCALLGCCSALLTVILRKAVRSRLWRYGLGMTGCSFIIVHIVKYLPGWEMKPAVATMLFLLGLCFFVTIINEYIFPNCNSKLQ